MGSTTPHSTGVIEAAGISQGWMGNHSVHGRSAGLSDYVDIQSNEPEGDRVLAFRHDPDGSLIQRAANTQPVQVACDSQHQESWLCEGFTARISRRDDICTRTQAAFA
jgi:hypothetical protein